MSTDVQSFHALLQRVHDGCDEAAWQIVARFGDHIRAVVRRRMHKGLRPFIDSEDFVQSVWGSLVRIGPRLRDIDRPEQLIALLSRMAQNKVIDEVRRRTTTKKHRLPGHGSLAEIDAGQPLSGSSLPPSPSQYAIARERWVAMLAGEPPQSRRIIELRLAGNSCVEIAAVLGINERTVRRTLKRLVQQDESA